jgi:hypothetical protein
MRACALSDPPPAVGGRGTQAFNEPENASMKINATRSIVVVAAMLLPACATVSIPDYPPDHPANADAQAAPPAAALRTLEDYKPRAVPQDGAPDSGASGEGREPLQKGGENHDHH